MIYSRLQLNSSQGKPQDFLPMRTCPYRNIRIVNVTRDMFFTGGNSSFSNRFRSEFPISQDKNGAGLCKVPIAMVSLVATVVSNTYDKLLVSDFD